MIYVPFMTTLYKAKLSSSMQACIAANKAIIWKTVKTKTRLRSGVLTVAADTQRTINLVPDISRCVTHFAKRWPPSRLPRTRWSALTTSPTPQLVHRPQATTQMQKSKTLKSTSKLASKNLLPISQRTFKSPYWIWHWNKNNKNSTNGNSRLPNRNGK